MGWYLKGHKFNAVRTEVDGIKFASKGEAQLYEYLKLCQLGKQCEIIDLQPKVYLTKARILYKPDFRVRIDHELLTIAPHDTDIFIEFKGQETPNWRLKRKLYAYYGEIPLVVIKKKGNNFLVNEYLCPANAKKN